MPSLQCQEGRRAQLFPACGTGQLPAKQYPEYQQGTLRGGDQEEAVGEGLFAGLVPEQRAAGIGAGRPAEQREGQQVSLRRAPPPPSARALSIPNTAKATKLIAIR